MASCYDCTYSVVKNGNLTCKKTGNNVEEKRNVCSKFAGTDAKLCEDCEYYEFGAFSRWNDHGKCSLTGKSRRDDDVACPRFCG